MDQPEEVEGTPKMASFYVKDIGAVEVRKRSDGRYFVTVGNLFVSQTVLCINADAVF